MSHHIDPDTRIHIEIDHISCEVAPETTILSAAAGLGIQIPTLCYMKELTPDGSCRMCVVEVDGGRKKGLVLPVPSTAPKAWSFPPAQRR